MPGSRKPVEVRIWANIVRFVQSVRRQADEVAGGERTTPAQFFIMATLTREGPQKQADLSERMGATPANISQRLVGLESAGLVRRVPSGREKIVSLTRKGAALVAELAPRHDAFIVSRFSALTKQERRTFLSLLERLLEPAGDNE